VLRFAAGIVAVLVGTRCHGPRTEGAAGLRPLTRGSAGGRHPSEDMQRGRQSRGRRERLGGHHAAADPTTGHTEELGHGKLWGERAPAGMNFGRVGRWR
jgi:hypothetical protein